MPLIMHASGACSKVSPSGIKNKNIRWILGKKKYLRDRIKVRSLVLSKVYLHVRVHNARDRVRHRQANRVAGLAARLQGLAIPARLQGLAIPVCALDRRERTRAIMCRDIVAVMKFVIT
jgi:hypothetical protein